MPEPSATGWAVFLSYAREDTDAARRIADALRAFGVEVSFHQSELRGGEECNRGPLRRFTALLDDPRNNAPLF